MSLLLAGVQGSLAFTVAAKRMRRLSDSCRGSAGQDISAAVAVDENSEAEEDSPYGAWATCRGAKKKGGNSTKKRGNRPKGADMIKGDGQEAYGFDLQTGECDRCYSRGSKNHLAPKCPRRKSGRPGSPVTPPLMNRAPRRSYSSISIENPASLRNLNEGGGDCGQSVSTALESGRQLVSMNEYRVAVLDAGATASMVIAGNTWSTSCRRLSGPGPIQVSGWSDEGCPFCRRYRRGVAGSKGNFTAFHLDADTPTLFREEALEGLGGKLDFVCDMLTFGFRGSAFPSR